MPVLLALKEYYHIQLIYIDVSNSFTTMKFTNLTQIFTCIKTHQYRHS